MQPSVPGEPRVNILLKHLEIILSVAGVIVVFTVSWLFFHAPYARWQAAAITAVAVGLLHGFIFYTVRLRQRQMRQSTIREMQIVVDDIVRNQMTVVSLSAQLIPSVPGSMQQREWAQRSIEAAHEIGRRLNEIDSERLSDLMRRRPH
jgi:cytochrome c biogenesis factor